MSKNKFVGLIIIDGFGIASKKEGNAVKLAHTPFIDSLYKKYPHSTLQASGLDVGLPEGQMGNSEVGHITIGSGRVLFQSLTRINNSIKDGSFFTNEAYLEAINHVKKYNSKLHVLCLCSDGGVHSHLEHIISFFELLKQQGISNKSYLHAFLDGRDTPPSSGLGYIKTLLDHQIQISTVGGRYYGMDRDNNFDRIQKAYDAMVFGKAEVKGVLQGIQDSYKEGINDEFVLPYITNKDGLIEDNDAIVMLNFRQDRAIRISTALSNPAGLESYYKEDKAKLVTKDLKNTLFVSTMQYSNTVKGLLAYPPQSMDNIYGDVVSKAGLKQIRIAETEKYAHVTFFFDGGEDREIKGATRVLVESPKVATYDLKPSMSALEVTSKAIDLINTQEYQTMVLNYANCDMVGHTGILSAAIEAVETIDSCLEKLITTILCINGVAVIIADHGNCEQMFDEEGKPHTAHTTNEVPIIITSNDYKTVHAGGLKDVSPTLLKLLGIQIPKEMDGTPLI